MRLTRSQGRAGKGGGDRRCLQLCGPSRASVSPHEGVRREVTAAAPSSYDVTPWTTRGAFPQAGSSRAPWAGEWGPGLGGAMAAVRRGSGTGTT